MTACPVCLGEGTHDFREWDRQIAEEWSDEQLAHARRLGLVEWLGVQVCEECEGTGEVTDDRARDLRAQAVAAVDQVLARVAADDHTR